jgi:SAM-dependent methyltransferase
MEEGARRILRCSACGFLWVPEGVSRDEQGRSIYEDDASVFFADGSADYYLDDTAREAAQAKLAWILRFVPGGALLDVGANVGQFAAVAAERFDTLGLEPSAPAVRWAREHLKAPVEVGSIYDDRPDLHARFAAVTLFDVIEHVPDAAGALDRCRTYLQPGGHLFVTTPDSGSVAARLLGRHWYYVDLKEHIGLFNRRNLIRLIESRGFAVVETRTIGRRYRFSYIERRLAFLASQGSTLLSLLHAAALPLRLAPQWTLPLNFGDVAGIVATPR